MSRTLTTSSYCGKCVIGPSILNADLSRLADECANLMDAGADYLHLDVMDGNFVPNLTFGHPLIECLRPKVPTAFFDSHMMVENPEKWINAMANAGTDQYTFHFEATSEPIKCARAIRENGMRAGIAISPRTSAESLLQLIDEVDMVLVMTVEPGFGGQSFKQDMIEKVSFLRSRFGSLNIGVDGGVNLSNIRSCIDAGANMIVCGSALVNAPDRKLFMHQLKDSANK